MKKLILLTLALALMIGNTANRAYAQQQDKEKGNNAAQAATNPQDDDEGIVAYSDTTSASDTVSIGKTHIKVGKSNITIIGDDDDLEDLSVDKKWLLDILSGTAGIGAMLFALFIVILIFIFLCAPFIIIALIIWYQIRKSNQRLEFARKAMESGQPLPQEVLPMDRQTDVYLWRKGLRNTFLGLGLVIAGGVLDMSLLIAIGFIVCFMGIGQTVIAKTTKKGHKQDKEQGEDEKLG